MPGKMAAQITAKRVIASAARLIDVRHFCRVRKRIAEIRVPAWPIPIQKTKLVMSQAQPTVLFSPHTPTPFEIWYPMQNNPTSAMAEHGRKASHHQMGVGASTMTDTFSVIQLIGR